eukprot:1235882-Lingulodinium_polyedra.AAC.1
MGSQEWVDTAIGRVLNLFRFKQFIDSRWYTVGSSCKSLIASLCVGLKGLVGIFGKYPRPQPCGVA